MEFTPLTPEEVADVRAHQEAIAAAKAAIAAIHRSHIARNTEYIKAEFARRLLERFGDDPYIADFLDKCEANITWGPVETSVPYTNNYGQRCWVYSILYEWAGRTVMFGRISHDTEGYYSGLADLEGFDLYSIDDAEFPDVWRSSDPEVPPADAEVVRAFLDTRERLRGGHCLESIQGVVPEYLHLATFYADPATSIFGDGYVGSVIFTGALVA